VPSADSRESLVVKPEQQAALPCPLIVRWPNARIRKADLPVGAELESPSRSGSMPIHADPILPRPKQAPRGHYRVQPGEERMVLAEAPLRLSGADKLHCLCGAGGAGFPITGLVGDLPPMLLYVLNRVPPPAISRPAIHPP